MKKIIILFLSISFFDVIYAYSDTANESIEIPMLSDQIDTKKSITTHPSTNAKSWAIGIYPKGRKVGGYIGGTSESDNSSNPQGKIFLGIGISVQF